MDIQGTCSQQLFKTRNSRKWVEADTQARVLESKDGQDRIVLSVDDEYRIFTLEECCKAFSDHEEEHADEIHIEEAFYNAQEGIPIYAFFDLILSVKGGCSDYFTRAYAMMMSKDFYMDEVRLFMDDEICAEFQHKLPTCSDLLYLTFYLKEHWERFGRPFVWN